MKAVTNMAKKERSPRQRAWASMRTLPCWDLGTIESTAEISRANVENYVYALIKSGYVRLMKQRKSGVKGSYTIYRLVRNTGPRCPRMRYYSSVMQDGNTHVKYVISAPRKYNKERRNVMAMHTHTTRTKHANTAKAL